MTLCLWRCWTHRLRDLTLNFTPCLFPQISAFLLHHPYILHPILTYRWKSSLEKQSPKFNNTIETILKTQPSDSLDFSLQYFSIFRISKDQLRSLLEMQNLESHAQRFWFTRFEMESMNMKYPSRFKYL